MPPEFLTRYAGFFLKSTCMFINFHYFQDAFHYFSLIFHYFEDGFQLFSSVFHYLTMFFFIFHWFFNVLKMCFISFLMLGRFFAIYMHILRNCSTWKTRDGRKFKILEFKGFRNKYINRFRMFRGFGTK